MTDLALAKAAKVLLNKDGLLGEDRYFPRLWMVGDEVCLFHNAAKRHQANILALYGRYDRIEEVTIQEAYQFIYGKPMPRHFERNIVQEFDQSGGLKEYEKYDLAHNPVNDPRIQIKITD